MDDLRLRWPSGYTLALAWPARADTVLAVMAATLAATVVQRAFAATRLLAASSVDPVPRPVEECS